MAVSNRSPGPRLPKVKNVGPITAFEVHERHDSAAPLSQVWRSRCHLLACPPDELDYGRLAHDRWSVFDACGDASVGLDEGPPSGSQLRLRRHGSLRGVHRGLRTGAVAGTDAAAVRFPAELVVGPGVCGLRLHSRFCPVAFPGWTALAGARDLARPARGPGLQFGQSAAPFLPRAHWPAAG